MQPLCQPQPCAIIKQTFHMLLLHLLLHLLLQLHLLQHLLQHLPLLLEQLMELPLQPLLQLMLLLLHACVFLAAFRCWLSLLSSSLPSFALY